MCPLAVDEDKETSPSQAQSPTTTLGTNFLLSMAGRDKKQEFEEAPLFFFLFFKINLWCGDCRYTLSNVTCVWTHIAY